MVRTAEIVKNDFWKSMGIGFAVVFLVPILFIVLLTTIIGAPIALIMIVLYFVMLYIAKVFTLLALGIKILPKSSPYLAYLLAVVIYTIVTIIPVIGGLVSLIVLLVGMGAFVTSKKAILSEYNK
jgi:uncharacterized membrane protein YhaH (DUF805 family)